MNGNHERASEPLVSGSYGMSRRPLVARARAFATWAHRAQVRKYTGEPYIAHPAAVVSIVKTVPHDQAMLAAAWLHDMVEDTEVGLPEIVERFGYDVAALVSDLTDTSVPSDGNRAARRAIDREHTANASARAQTIKLADLLDNTRTIVAHDPAFAKVYLEEKEALLSVLTKGDSDLWRLANQQLVAAKRMLNCWVLDGVAS